MKTLYLDCSMGAAGDMLTAALLELFEDQDEIIRELNKLGIPHVQFERETVNKCGIRGTHIRVRVHGMEEGEQRTYPSPLSSFHGRYQTYFTTFKYV